MKPNNDVKEILRKNEIKCTSQREIVLNILIQSKTPLTAEQIYIYSKEANNLINLSTVYRVLELLLSKDIIKKLSFTDEGSNVYEIKDEKHRHYLICMGCKKIIPVCGCPIEEYEKNLNESSDFKILGHSLELYGYCTECSKDK